MASDHALLQAGAILSIWEVADVETIFQDANNRPLVIGAKVRTSADDSSTPPGEVIRFTEWDGDADREGRPIAYPPAVVVLWPGDDIEDTYHTYSYGYDEGVEVRYCDDLEVVD